MSKQHAFRPNYSKLYPGVVLSVEVQKFLEKTDMRMEYEDFHRKRQRIVKEKNKNVVVVLPGLEDSLDRLVEANHQFWSQALSPEEQFIATLEIKELYRCLDCLDVKEQMLIDALFFRGITERVYAQSLAISKTALHARKLKALEKLKNLLSYRIL